MNAPPPILPEANGPRKVERAAQRALAYASVSPVADPSPVVRMRRWRRLAGWGICLAVAGQVSGGGPGSLVFALLSIGFVLFCFGCVAALVFMYRAAEDEFGTSYAVRHLIFAILGLPVFLLGLFLVTHLVEADLRQRQLADAAEDEPPA